MLGLIFLPTNGFSIKPLKVGHFQQGSRKQPSSDYGWLAKEQLQILMEACHFQAGQLLPWPAKVLGASIAVGPF